MKPLHLLFAFSLVHFSSVFSQSLPGSMLDTSFSYDGKVVTKEAAGDSSHALINGLVLQSDGKLIAAGQAQKDDYSTSSIVLTRYLPNGKPDHSFGNKGVLHVNYKDYVIHSLYDIKQQSSGKMVAIGYAYSIQNGVIHLLFRFNKDGLIDSSFGDSGWTILPEEGNSIDIQSNDGIIITSERQRSDGRKQDTLILRRYKKNGTMDSVFGKDGIAMAIAKRKYVHGVYPVVTTDNMSRIVAGFTAANNSSTDAFMVTRFTQDGLPDSSFNKVGIATINDDSPDYLYAITIQPDNKIIVGGESNLHGDFLIARLNVNGTIDSLFGDSGKVTIDFKTNEKWGSTDYVTGLIIQDNRIVATGTSDQTLYGKTFALARFFADGKLDKSFGFDGKTLTRFLLGDAVSNVSIMQPDGKIICGGYAQKGTNSGQEDFAISRYLTEKIALPVATDEKDKTIKPSQLIAYPNPAQNVLHLRGFSSSNTKLTVVDFMGNVKLQTVATGISYNLNIATLIPGNYLLKIEMNGAVVSKKFTKE